MDMMKPGKTLPNFVTIPAIYFVLSLWARQVAQGRVFFTDNPETTMARIDKYEVVGEIGRGLGAVYNALHPQFKK
jgi:hypothetical protein